MMSNTRREMISNGGNLGWCMPYSTKDGDVWIAVAEGRICGARINGCDTDNPSAATIARRVNPDYALYSGWSELYIALDAMDEHNCRDCPWFWACDAMDDV